MAFHINRGIFCPNTVNGYPGIMAYPLDHQRFAEPVIACSPTTASAAASEASTASPTTSSAAINPVVMSSSGRLDCITLSMPPAFASATTSSVYHNHRQSLRTTEIKV